MSVASWIEEAIVELPAGSIIVTDKTEANLRWAGNALTTNGQMHSRTATVVREGEGDDDAVVSGPVGSAADLVELVRSVSGSSGAVRPVRAVEGDFGDEAVGTTIEVFESLASGLGQAFEDACERGASLYGFAEHQLQTVWVATTAGERERAVVPMGRLELNAKASDLANSAWTGQATNDFTDVDVAAHVQALWTRLAWGENVIDLPAGRYETLLPPSAVADFMIYAYWTMNGRDAREGRNVYSGPGVTTRVGERLSTLPITLSCDPAMEGMPQPSFAVVPENQPGIASVRDNAQPVGRVEWITDGVLTNLIEPRTNTNETLLFPTQNLACEAGGTSSLDEMIASTERGLLLTCLWYIREVDPETLLLTGLTRDGVYLIEDGHVVGRVNNFRYNESPISLMRRATEASVAEPTLCREWNDYFTMTRMPALRIPDFNMSTVSQAS